MRKKIISVFMIMVLLFSFSVSASAATNNSQITPQYLYTNQIITNISIDSNGTANILAKATGFPGKTTQIKIFAYLQQYKNGTWTNIKSWSQTTSSANNTLQKSNTVTKGYSYRVKGSYYVYEESEYENIVKYSSVISY